MTVWEIPHKNSHPVDTFHRFVYGYFPCCACPYFNFFIKVDQFLYLKLIKQLNSIGKKDDCNKNESSTRNWIYISRHLRKDHRLPMSSVPSFHAREPAWLTPHTSRYYVSKTKYLFTEFLLALQTEDTGKRQMI